MRGRVDTAGIDFDACCDTPGPDKLLETLSSRGGLGEVPTDVSLTGTTTWSRAQIRSPLPRREASIVGRRVDALLLVDVSMNSAASIPARRRGSPASSCERPAPTRDHLEPIEPVLVSQQGCSKSSGHVGSSIATCGAEAGTSKPRSAR